MGKRTEALWARWDAQAPPGARPLTSRADLRDFTDKMRVLGWRWQGGVGQRSQRHHSLGLLALAGLLYTVEYHGGRGEEDSALPSRYQDYAPTGAVNIVETLLRGTPFAPRDSDVVALLREGREGPQLQAELAVRSLAR